MRSCRRYEPRQMLDPADPVSIGAMVGPEAFTEVRYLAHHKQLRALALMPQLAAEFQKQFGRDSGGLIRTYRTDDAETIVVALGSVNGTVQEVVDEMRARGLADRLGVDLLVPSVSARRLREALQACEARRRAREVPGGGPGRHRLRWRAQVACRASCSMATPSSPAWAGARSPALR